MKTLFATDLDGTFLDADARPSQYTIRRFNELTRDGALITFVTARTPATIEPIMEGIHPTVPAVCMTGSAWWDFTEHRYLRHTYHRPDDVATILDICRREGVTPFVYTLPHGTNDLVVYHEAPHLTPLENTFVFERTISHLKTFHLHTHAPADSADCTVLLFAMGNPDSIRRTALDIRANTRCYASWYPDTYNPGIALLEVFAEGVSKAAGLLALKDHLHADRIVAFGDNLNDLPMLAVADTAVAVANAHPDVLAAAHTIIPANTTNSVIDYIAQNL